MSCWGALVRPPGSQGHMPSARPPAETLVTPLTQNASLAYTRRHQPQRWVSQYPRTPVQPHCPQ